MTALINFSLFQYKCIETKKDGATFTFKTDKNQVKKIIKDFFDFLKEFTKSKNIMKDFPREQTHFHPIKNLEKRDLILKIFQKFGYKSEFIDQYLGDSPNIWQIKTNSEIRLFFLKEDKVQGIENYCIIKPLFLDINHAIYNEKQIAKNFNICLICWEKRCVNTIS